MTQNNWKSEVKNAAASLNLLLEKSINSVLNSLAEVLENNIEGILQANALDLAKMDTNNPMFDRLKLTPERIQNMAAEVRNVAQLPSPTHLVKEEFSRPNGIKIQKITVPFGVIGVIYEARPNVTIDVFSLCFKSSNVAVLKGGSDAYNSNEFLVKIIQEVLEKHQITTSAVNLLTAERDAATDLMNAVGIVDVIIPRGGQGLINYVRDHSKVPVIETGAGVVHVYFDQDGDIQKGKKIIFNSKTRRVSVCNALDCLLIHQDRLSDLNELVKDLSQENVSIFADETAFEILKNSYPENLLFPVTKEHFGTEFLDYKLAIKTVNSLQDALSHIAEFSSQHSECIITENQENAEIFSKNVDAACVYTNVSTAFTDGAQFGLGAEIGISTQKLHARGPMALEALCSYKYLIKGDGQIRS